MREEYQRRHQYVLVDEFQDTNKAQYQLVQHLAGELRNVFVVGDEDQSIYSWRGADFRNVLRFRSDFPEAQTFLLEQNYRSTQTILDAAQAVISRNAQRTAKTLWTDNDAGQKIELCEVYDEREEADYVVGEIQRLVTRGVCTFRDCAVMFRTNAQSRALEDTFVRQGLPYKLVGAARFYQRREVKDVLGYLRIAHNPDDDVSLGRIINVPRRGIGAKTVLQLTTWASSLGMPRVRALLYLAENGRDGTSLGKTPFAARARRSLVALGTLFSELRGALADRTLGELLQLTLDKTQYLDHIRDGSEEGEDRVNNVRELFSAVQRYEHLPLQVALPTFLEEAALATDVDQLNWESDASTLLTLHAAKGLEFDSVFIVGMEEGLCPLTRAEDDDDALEEERRLCYVGITRAMQRVYLVRTFRRTIYGRADVRDPSRFLGDIPSKLVEGNLTPPGRVGLSTSGRQSARSSTGATSSSRRDVISRRRAAVKRLRTAATVEASARRVDRARERQAQAAQSPAPHHVDPAPRKELEFRVGETVVHPVFGSGTVVTSVLSGDDEEVTVAFEGRGIKRLMASYAKLRKD